MSNWEDMLAGRLFSCADPEIAAAADRCRDVLFEFNHTRDRAAAVALLRSLFGQTGEHFWVEPGFHCDYGCNISVGDHFYANAGCVILDECPVTFGRDCMLGPQVGVYTATHPIDGAERRKGLEYGRSITVGDDVWIGGHAVILPGVTVGSDVVIAAGAVVARDVPDHCVVAGNPAKIIRRLDENHGL